MKKVIAIIFIITFFAVMTTGPPLLAMTNISYPYMTCTIDPALTAENSAAVVPAIEDIGLTTDANSCFIIIPMEDACVCDKLSVLKCPDNADSDFFLNAYDDDDTILSGRRSVAENLSLSFTANVAGYNVVISSINSSLTPEVVDKTLTGLQPDGHNRQLWKRFEVGWNLARFYVSLDGVTRA